MFFIFILMYLFLMNNYNIIDVYVLVKINILYFVNRLIKIIIIFSFLVDINNCEINIYGKKLFIIFCDLSIIIILVY